MFENDEKPQLQNHKPENIRIKPDSRRSVLLPADDRTISDRWAYWAKIIRN